MHISKLNHVKRRKKYFSIHLDIPPRQKSSTFNKGEVQRLFIAEMKRRGIESLSGNIAVQIITYTSDRRAPGIAALAKNLLDIMHKQDYLIDMSENKHLPFLDDSQIKYLFVKYVFAETNSATFIKMKPFSSFISDLNALDKKVNTYDFDSLDESEYYKDLKQNREWYVQNLSEKAYEALVSMSLERIQRDFGRSVSITPHLIQTCYPKRTPFGKEIKQIFGDWKELLLSASIRLKLPSLPAGPKGQDATDEQKKEYKQTLRCQLSEYSERFSILTQLQYPIIVSVIYRPSRIQKNKDLDNIMLEYIVPAFNEVMEPPAAIFGLREYEHAGELRVPTLAKEMHGKAIGYEILQIPPSLDSSKPGELYLGFRLDDHEDSMMDDSDRVIDRILEREY